MNTRLTIPLLAVAIVVAGAGAALTPHFRLLHETWTAWYGPNEHGYMVLALCIWMSAANWIDRPPRQLKPWWPAAAAFALVVGLAIAFNRFGIDTMRVTLLPLFVLASVTMIFGTAAGRRILWPILFLYFALPQWWYLNPLLQSLTVAVVNVLVRLAEIPAFINGNIIHLPSGVFEIASGCSGLNYVLVANMLGWFFAWKNLDRAGAKLALLLAANAVALLANWVRVFVLIYLGHRTRMQHYLVAEDHHMFGWILFLVFMIPVLFLGRKLQSADEEIPDRTDHDPVATATAYPYSLLMAAGLAALMLLLIRVVPGA